MANQIKLIKNVTDFISMLHQIQFDPDPGKRESNRKREKRGSLLRKGIHNLLPAVGQLNCALNAITRSKNRSTNCANAVRKEREREQLGNFWWALRGSLLFCVLSEYLSYAVIKFTSCSTV